MKGISPLIATVLLIAFTVAVAGILSTWLTSFTKGSADTVKKESDTQLSCSFGGVSFSTVKYCAERISGIVENTGSVGVGNLSIQILYSNGTTVRFNLNTTLEPRESQQFNLSANSNYNIVRAITNCSSVFDEAKAGEISTSC